MNTPENWSQLTNEVAGLLVPPAQALRPDVAGALQYVAGDTEYLALNSTTPYGTETESAFAPFIRPAHLFEGAAQGPDWTTFVIPEEVLALQALTHGTGQHKAELLESAYHDVGILLGNLSTRPDVRAPLIRSSDIALDRSSGEILLIPPLSFGEKAHKAGAYLAAFIDSIAVDLRTWPDAATELIKNSVVQGVEDGKQTG